MACGVARNVGTPGSDVLFPAAQAGSGSQKARRIVLVSPFSDFNYEFNWIASESPFRVKIEEISAADLRNPPYINITNRESGVPHPYALVDFGFMKVEGKDNPVPYLGYLRWWTTEWLESRVPMYTPSSRMMKAVSTRQRANPRQWPPGFMDWLGVDLYQIMSGEGDPRSLKLFFKHP